MTDRTRRSRAWRGFGGFLLALIGSGSLIGLQLIVYGHSPEAERLQMALGLAGATLASAVAQVALLVGVWLAWSANRTGTGD